MFGVGWGWMQQVDRDSTRQVEELEVTEYREDVQLSGRERDWKPLHSLPHAF